MSRAQKCYLLPTFCVQLYFGIRKGSESEKGTVVGVWKNDG